MPFENINNITIKYKGKEIPKLLRKLGNENNSNKHQTSFFEQIVENNLKKLGIEYLHNKVSFYVGENAGKKYYYTPDFLLPDLTICNKMIFLESHGATLFNDGVIKKYNKFMNLYNNLYYLIILTNEQKSTIKKIIRKFNGIEIASEIIYIKGNPSVLDEDNEFSEKIYNILRYIKEEKADKTDSGNVNEVEEDPKINLTLEDDEENIIIEYEEKYGEGNWKKKKN